MAFSRRDFLQILASIPMLPGFARREITTPHAMVRPGQMIPEQITGSFGADTGALFMLQHMPEDYPARINRLSDLPMGMILQQASFHYRQAVHVWRPKKEEDPDKVFYIGGQTQGTMMAARVIAPTAMLSELRRRYGDIENLDKRPLLLEVPIGDTKDRVQYELHGCCLVYLGEQVRSVDMSVVERVDIMFQKMLMPDGRDLLGKPSKEFKFPFAGMQSCPQS